MSEELFTMEMLFGNGDFALRYVINAKDLALAREEAHEKATSIKSGIRNLPDFETADKETVDNFVMDCALLCIASEMLGKRIFRGTPIASFSLTEGTDRLTQGLTPFGRA